jgi:hypothetical protein
MDWIDRGVATLFFGLGPLGLWFEIRRAPNHPDAARLLTAFVMAALYFYAAMRVWR